MKISQFEQVLAVSKTGSINLAAEQLFISQSQLSSSVRALERELGADIFIRSNKGISLTPFGEEFLPYITSVLIQIDQIKQLGTRSFNETKLSIVSGGFRFVSDLVSAMYTRYASNGICIEVYDYPGLKPIDIVANQIADIGIFRIWNHQKKIIMKQIKSRELQFYLLETMPLTVIVGPQNPLYYSPNSCIYVNELYSYSPIKLSYMQHNPISSIYKEFPQLNTKSEVFCSSRNMLYEIIAKTDMYYITATPTRAYQETDYYPNTRILTLDETRFNAQLGWIKRKDAVLSNLGQDFIQRLMDYFQI